MNRLKYTSTLCIVLLISLIFQNNLLAQVSEGGMPFSSVSSALKSAHNIPLYKAEAIDRNQLVAEDQSLQIDNRIARFEDVVIDIRANGVKTYLPEQEGSIWQYRVEGKNAYSIQLYFSNLILPGGAKLFIHNDNYSRILGAYTEVNNSKRNQLMVENLRDNHAVIEYFEPEKAEFEGVVELGAIGQAYLDVFSSNSYVDSKGFLDINSPDGEDWQNEKHSVCRMFFREGNSGYTCTGALINNTRSDGTPYFLTANHCISTDQVAGTLVTYFNWETYNNTQDTLFSTSLTLSGASLLTNHPDSDFTLLQLDNIPPASYQPYYAPWDATDIQTSNAMGIHHPGGQPKKASLDYSFPVSYGEPIAWNDNSTTPANSHWAAEFDKGQTAGGSSGSPLFNVEKRQVIGQLHGGGSTDYYGKLSSSFALNPSKNIRTYLDPDKTNVDELETGFYPAENLPDPQFYPEILNVCQGTPVKLTAFSAFSPTAWSWSFTPNTVEFAQGTDQNDRQPIVIFQDEGEYDVELTVTNAGGTATRQFPAAVSSGNALSVEIERFLVGDSCLCTFDSLLLMGSGAEDYKWMLDETSAEYFFIENDSINPAVIKMISNPSETTSILLTLRGSHGNCSSDISYSLALLKPANDSIKDAEQLFLGESEYYSNYCAGIEENEPIPPYTSCTGTLSWCDEYGTGEDIIENSIWFYFIPQMDGRHQIRTSGMDNQVALYETDSEAALLAGNYQLLGANDDATNNNYNPVITVDLKQGIKYMIQADGSAGGSAGRFFFNIKNLDEVGIDGFSAGSSPVIYPQPASDQLTINYAGFTSSKEVTTNIYDLSGSLLFSRRFVKPSNRTLNLSLDGINSGVYFLRIKVDNDLFTEKLIKH